MHVLRYRQAFLDSYPVWRNSGIWWLGMAYLLPNTLDCPSTPYSRITGSNPVRSIDTRFQFQPWPFLVIKTREYVHGRFFLPVLYGLTMMLT
jgi:hypothetical protein